MKRIKSGLYILLGLSLFWVLLKGYVFYKATSIFEYSHSPNNCVKTSPERNPIGKVELNNIKKINFVLTNLSFVIPQYNKVVKDSSITNKARIITFVDNSKVIVTYDSDIEGLDYLKHFNEISKNLDSEYFNDYLSKHNIKTNYQFLKYTYNFKPNDISIFDSNNEIVVENAILRLKELVMVNGYDIYFNNFETPNIKGFQFGRPGVSKITLLNIFDSNDQQYSIISSGKLLKQEYIDYIISRIKTNGNTKLKSSKPPL